MAEELRIDERTAIPLAEVELRTSRSSGPGGQHANVTASRVEAVFDVEASRSLDEARRVRLLERLGPVVTAVAQDGRSQYRNRELALEPAGSQAGRRPPRPSPPSPDQAHPRLAGATPRRQAPYRRAQGEPPPPVDRRLAAHR